MPCIVFPDNSITGYKKNNFANQHNWGIYENYDFLKKNLKISFRTGQLFLCDNSFGKKLLKKTLWEYDLYKERSSISIQYHKFVDVCQYDLCKKYVQKSFLSDL